MDDRGIQRRVIRGYSDPTCPAFGVCVLACGHHRRLLISGLTWLPGRLRCRECEADRRRIAAD
jgi:hypothetical protein